MTKKDDECVELKNIKYQTMLMNKTKQNETPKKHTTNIEQFLNRESMQNTKKPWNKLEKSIKRKKLSKFVETFPTKHKEMLKQYLYQCLERKKLQRTKDVIYDMDKGKIEKIPGLSFNKNSNKYTLRRIDKKISTLKSLAPKKRKKKIDIHLKE